ncbi:4'-phosphopantetheinyl transferase superfamily protein [Streptomyces sp. FH025]|uniref:4'-phosphopantetheinyl transferase family protein n=1 Tax=Streptomyces sp. FH025 TaxID=2815937 RepID=UPI001A9FF9E3|nr:4'-phosphopantetheinyl transferase superfamily protein [Streptomyces sp. FH025]MBO1413069.1 4'-phosphopantetheinyl transferase superfamily protein [Streptomyces sp. FH025]
MRPADPGAAVRPLPPVHLVAGPEGPWEALAEDLRTGGVGLLQASLSRWEREQPAGPRLRELLGPDWDQYQESRSPAVRNRFAASRVLLRCAVATALKVSPGHVEFGYHISGRPYVRGFDQVDISMSHSADLLLIGLTSLGRIGVDVEPAERAPSIAELDRHICTRAELAALVGRPEEEYQRALLRTWVLKEAYTKALGQGMYFPFTEFGFQLTEGGAELRTVEGRPVNEPSWSFHCLPLADGCQGAVALQEQHVGSVRDTRAATAVDRRTALAIWGRRTPVPGLDG